jgi:small subunit ribosomal protein S5
MANQQQRGGGGGGGGRDRGRNRRRRDEPEFDERIVNIARTSKVLKGGRTFRFRVIVVVGDNRGKVGVAIGKANEVPEAIRKGVERAKRAMIQIPILDGTIPHEITHRKAAAKVMLRPAAPGTGVIAGSGGRAVLEAAGVKNILTKSHGSDNILNVTFATFEALQKLKDPVVEARRRGKKVAEVAPFWSTLHEQ